VRVTARDGNPSIDALLHVPLRITARIGSCRLTVSEILQLGNGSVVELDRAAGEPVDVLANDRCIARGEIVAIGDNFGIRIVELLEPHA
jgi:flagellar motor switch protein FliN/FliY